MIAVFVHVFPLLKPSSQHMRDHNHPDTRIWLLRVEAGGGGEGSSRVQLQSQAAPKSSFRQPMQVSTHDLVVSHVLCVLFSAIMMTLETCEKSDSSSWVQLQSQAAPRSSFRQSMQVGSHTCSRSCPDIEF